MQQSYDEIRELLEHNPGQGSLEEYKAILDTIRARAPAKLLIFGVGKDSRIWFHANRGGRTVFVEHEPEWIAQTRAELPEAEIAQVSYRTRLWQWRLLLGLRGLLFMRDLPPAIVNERWDIIFVDSPQGGNWRRPGRMKSLYTAAILARRSRNVDLLAHDCDRRVERVYCDRYLGDQRLLREIRTLRHYRIGECAGAVADRERG